MPSLDVLLPFFLATAIVACIPGPGMFYAAAQTMPRGRQAGWLSALGLHISGYVHISAAAFGLAVLLETIPVLYAIVKLAGAAYLIWLGIKSFTASEPSVRPMVIKAKSCRHALRDSIIVGVLNTKIVLFYLAFLPQFTDGSASLPIWMQIFALGFMVNVMFSATDAVCVLLSARMTRILSASHSANRLAQWIGGGILIGLGVKLATSRQ